MMTVKVMMMMKFGVSLLILQVGSLVGNDAMIPLLIFRLFDDSSDGIKWYYHHKIIMKRIMEMVFCRFCCCCSVSQTRPSQFSSEGTQGNTNQP